jgi:7-cyano-7-deazaguanine synthase
LLFSGGIDSTCLAWMERPDRLTFIDYGQIPAAGEQRACEAIAADLGFRLDVLRADLCRAPSNISMRWACRTPCIGHDVLRG